MLRLTCPQCFSPYWMKCQDGWKCAACGSFVYPENMGMEVTDARSDVEEVKKDQVQPRE